MRTIVVFPEVRRSAHEIQRIIEANSMPEPNSGCWLWLGSVNHHGYGMAAIGGVRRPAHRLSCKAYGGEIPKGYGVLHRCDVTGCVNPEHLRAGTHLENMREMNRRGRAVNLTGSRHGSAKLTEEQVRLIRLSTMTHRQAASHFGVSKSLIEKIRRGLLWKEAA